MTAFQILLAIPAAVAVTTAGFALRHRLRIRKRPARRRVSSAPSPSQLSDDERDSVYDEAELAAAHAASTGQQVPNPHAKGSRAFVLWVTHYESRLMELQPD